MNHTMQELNQHHNFQATQKGIKKLQESAGGRGTKLDPQLLDEFGARNLIKKPPITMKIAVANLPPFKTTSARRKLHTEFQKNPTMECKTPKFQS